jgi:DNA-binding IclR family transcriptional regulator
MGKRRELPQPTPGAQTLRRGLDLLRRLGRDPAAGQTYQELAAAAGLRRSTAHRLLTCLLEEDFAMRDPATHRYHVGVATMRLGFASMQRPPLVARYQALLKRLARRSGETVLLMARMGDHCMCLHREEGPRPGRILRSRVGDMWPLGVGAGGMAILSTLPPQEAEAVFERQAAGFEAAGLSRTQVLRTVARCQREGYVSMVDTVTRGAAGIAAAMPGEPSASVVIADVRRTVLTARRGELAALLLQELRADRA